METATVIEDRDYRSLIVSAQSTLSNFLIGFALPTEEADHQLNANLGGSGTLVTVDDVHGILTADHVVALLEKQKTVGLILASANRELHHLSFEFPYAQYFSLPGRGEPSIGPDMGILVPPPNVLEVLRARKSFYNLSLRQQAMLTKRPPADHGFWLLSGFAGEYVNDDAPEQGFSRVKVFKGFMGAGIVSREYSIGHYDYLVFPALYNERYEGPDSFGGFSGGSLWQILVRQEGISWRITDRLLSGVAFYESEKMPNRDGTVRDIICHGPTTIYKTLIDKIRGSSGTRP